MTQLLKLAQVNTNGIQNQDLTTLEIVGDSFTFGGASGTNLTKTIVDLLIANTHAPMSDNQNVVAGTGLTGGGSGATTTINFATGDASLVVSADSVIVGKSATGGIILAVDGLAINVDASTLQLVSNVLSIKDQGVTTAKLADANVTVAKLASDTTTLIASKVPQTRTVSTTAPLNGGGDLTADRTLTITQSSSGADGYLSSTDWNTFNSKQPAGAYLTALTGDVSASGPGSAASTVNSVGGSSAANVHSAELLANAATALNTALAIVKRDGSGNFAAGTITAALIGNVTGTASGNVPNGRLVSTTAPLTGGGALSADLTISIPKATGSVDGYLAATDFSTFNNKQPAGNYITALTGDVVATGPGSVGATIQTGVVTLAKLASGSVDENKLLASAFNAAGAIVGGGGTKLAVQVDASTIEINTNALRVKDAGITLAKLATGSVDENKILASAFNAAGAIVGGGGTKLAVQVDGSTLEINTNAIRVKDAGITLAKLASLSVDENKLTASVAGNGLSGGAGTALAVNVDGTTITIVGDTLQANQTPLIKQTLVAGETMAANTSFLVRWAVSGETAGRVYKADSGSAASQGKFYAMGVAFSAAGVTAGQNIDVVQLGTSTLGAGDTAFGGTDIGKAIYLTTSGAFSVTPPSTSAAAVYRIGMVRSTTQIYVGMQQLNGINP